jgi:hypothetical protein
MYAHNVPKRLARALAPRFAAGVVVTLALLSAACSNSDPASRINAPSLSASMNKGYTPGGSGGSGGSGPSLGAASGFAVLSVGTGTVIPRPSPDGTAAVTLTRTTVTGNVGSAGAVDLTNSTITGNLVSSGARAITPPSTISGSNTQPLPPQVITDFNAEYDRLKSNTTTPCTVSSSATTFPTTPLPPGVYCFDAAVTAVTGSTLTLNGSANDTWIFKIGTVGTGALTGTDFTVLMTGGATACNVTWWVAQAASMTRGAFNGTILAGAAIKFDGNVVGAPPIAPTTTFTGGALAKAGVTLTDVALVGCEGRNGHGNGNGDGDDDGDHGHHGDKDHGDKDHGDKGHGDKGHENDNHKNDGHSDREGGH